MTRVCQPEDDEEVVYTCPDCGCHDFVLEQEGIVQRLVTETLPCTCEAGEEYAVRIVRDEWTREWRRGPIDETHHVEWEEHEVLEGDSETVEDEVRCAKCLEEDEDDPDPNAWEVEEEDEDPEEDDVFRVHCADCEREIEFGWSHQDRGGRIWPVASSDFNPWKSWPEPRFRDAWRARGWLRPGRR